MKAVIEENVMSSDFFRRAAVGILPAKAVLRGVSVQHEVDAEGKPTSEVKAVRYRLVDPTTFSTFTVKVENAKPVIVQEAVDGSENPVLVELPLEDVTIKPYEVAYGKAKVTIQSPSVKLAK